MQDLATEIASQLEPSEPLGYRLLMFGGAGWGDVVFEAKAVAFKGRTAFMVRGAPKDEYSIVRPVPPLSELWQAFAPSEDALKFLIRQTYNVASFSNSVCVVLMPPCQRGYDRMQGEHVNLCVGNYGTYQMDDVDSHQERALSETVAALTLLKLPPALKWAA